MQMKIWMSKLISILMIGSLLFGMVPPLLVQAGSDLTAGTSSINDAALAARRTALATAYGARRGVQPGFHIPRPVGLHRRYNDYYAYRDEQPAAHPLPGDLRIRHPHGYHRSLCRF